MKQKKKKTFTHFWIFALTVFKDISDSTSVYHKPTLTDLLTAFDSFIPIVYKKGLIFSLVDHYFNICLAYEIFHTKLIKLKEVFIKMAILKNF